MLSKKLMSATSGAAPAGEPSFFNKLYLHITTLDTSSWNPDLNTPQNMRFNNIAPSGNSPRHSNQFSGGTGSATFPGHYAEGKYLNLEDNKGIVTNCYNEDIDTITSGSVVFIVNTEDSSAQFLTGGINTEKVPYIGRWELGADASDFYNNSTSPAATVSSLRMNKADITQLRTEVNNGKWNMLEFRGVDLSNFPTDSTSDTFGLNAWQQTDTTNKLTAKFMAMLIFRTSLNDTQHDELYDYFDDLISDNTTETLGASLYVPQAPIAYSTTTIPATGASVYRVPIVRDYVSSTTTDVEKPFRIVNFKVQTSTTASQSTKLYLGVRNSADQYYRHDMAIGRVEILNGSTVIDSFDPQHNLTNVNLVEYTTSWETRPIFVTEYDNQFTDNGTLYTPYWNVMTGTGSSGTGVSTGLPSSYTGSSPTNALPASGTVAVTSGGNDEYWGFESSSGSANFKTIGHIGWFKFDLGTSLPQNTTLTVRIAYVMATNNNIDTDYTLMAFWYPFG